MSTTDAVVADERCAYCGITGGDNIKLKNCTACKLVKYCGVECQRNHRSQHKRACKKRATELKDDLLFKQPESTHLGDCPICLLPLPFAKTQETQRYTNQSCCSKVVCNGCNHANKLRELEERLSPKCPFCRTEVPSTDAQCLVNQKRRAKANDPAALNNIGMRSFDAGDYATAIQYWEKAAEIGGSDGTDKTGCIDSHSNLSIAYRDGYGVEQDMKKYIYHMEKAAIGGHPIHRNNLGSEEMSKGNIDRAAKHFIIAANLGLDLSLQALRDLYTRGVVSKEDFAAALRAYQDAVDATKSPQRDAAEEFRKMTQANE